MTNWRREATRKLFARLWDDYRARVPDAARIEERLRARGDSWVEDHVAFRTFPGAQCGKELLHDLFAVLGYVRKDPYHFEGKKLDAFWMQPGDAEGGAHDEAAPKIFVSELITGGFSDPFRAMVDRCAAEVTADPADQVGTLAAAADAGDARAADLLVDTLSAFLVGGPAWRRPTRAEVELLRKESEYAAWTVVFGSRVNHFTISAHLMRTVSSLAELNALITGELGIPMNAAGGGVIKGQKELGLEQSATLAGEVPVLLQDGIERLPFAFVEFAFRHPLAGQQADRRWSSYYQGFVTDNADKIFESTNRRG